LQCLNFSGITVSVGDQIALVNNFYSFRMNKNLGSPHVEPYFNNMASNPQITFTSGSYNSSSRVFQWLPSSVGDKAIVTVGNGLQHFDFRNNKKLNFLC
jgi:hypothetical protein